jgi:Cupredoxin-like domain
MYSNLNACVREKKMKMKMRFLAMTCAVVVAGICAGSLSAEESAAVAISVKAHQFDPAELHAPANKPLAIRVKNLDGTPMEFESKALRVEKVISAGGEGVVNVRALAPGRYEFFDDFHQQTRGFLVVE